MAQKRIVLIFVLVLLLVAGLVVWRNRPVPAPISLQLTGTPGLKVFGEIVIDGVTQEYSGELPASIKATAQAFEYTIRMEEAKGDLHGELTVGDQGFGSSGTTDNYSGVRGSFEQTWISKSAGFTTVRSEQ